MKALPAKLATRCCAGAAAVVAGVSCCAPALADDRASAPVPAAPAATEFRVHPIGWVRRSAGRTLIEVDPRYQPALLGVAELDAIWVLYWFDRNDTPARRAILQVHPRADPANPLRGVFATRAPVRPNLIALSRCRVLGVEGNVIEIDAIDAFTDSPVLDIKR